jgi:ankyrin repeat protein
LLARLKAKALDPTHPKANRALFCLQLAFAMIDGFGGSIDAKGALDWLMKSGELDCLAAHGVAYNIFAALSPVVPSMISETEKLLKWLRHAASSGSPLALKTLRRVDVVAYIDARSTAMTRFHLPHMLPDNLTPIQMVGFLFSNQSWELDGQYKNRPITEAMFNKQRDKLIHFGAAYGVQLERFVDYLNKFTPELNEQNANGDTALLLAMRSGQAGHAKVLLQHGAKADIHNKLGQLPSHWIIQIDEVEIIEELLNLLIQKGADLSTAAQREDVNPLEHYTMIPFGGPVLHWAVLEAREDIVAVLLERGVNPLQLYHETTALHLAIQMHEHAILRQLLKDIKVPWPPPLSIGEPTRLSKPGSSTSSWLAWSMRMSYHWHVLHHGSNVKIAFFSTLDELRRAGVIGPNISHGLSWGLVWSPPDYVRPFLQFLGDEASVDLMAEALITAVPQADPLVVSVMVEILLEIAPSNVAILKRVFFGLTKSLMPAPAVIESLLPVLGNVDVRDDDGDTAFAKAIHSGNLAMAAEYLRLGANVNILLPARNSLHSEFSVNVLHYLIALNNDSVVSGLEFLLEPQRPNQMKPDFVVDKDIEYTALHVSCLWDNIAIFQVIIRHFRDIESVNATSKTGHTALHHSARTGILEKVRALCELGANVNAKTETGFTARDMCQTMQTGGSANITRTLEYWETILVSRLRIDDYLAKRRGKCRQTLLPNAFRFLIHAVQTGKSRLFDDALKFTPEHCKSREHLDAFLFLAARQGHHKIVQKLIQAGAAVFCTSKSTATPLHIAAENGRVKTARVLVNSGAALYAKDRLGRSPIMLARSQDHRPLVRYLLHEASKLDPRNIEKSEKDVELENIFLKEEQLLDIFASKVEEILLIPDSEAATQIEAEQLENDKDE